MRSFVSHSAARRRRRWLAVTIAAAWIALATFAQAHTHAEAAAAHSHCSTCHWVRGAAAIVPTVAAFEPPAGTIAIESAERLPAARHVARRQLYLRGPPRS
jgi:hypothetical protein